MGAPEGSGEILMYFFRFPGHHPFMRRTVCLTSLIVAAAWSGLGGSGPRAFAGTVGLHDRVQAQSALLMDAQSGEVLFARRVDEPLPPASTVKLMTALMTWEATGLRGQVKIEPSDTRVEPSHVPLRAGETVSVRDLTTALLVGSDNDTAMALARHVAGSHEAFNRLMNQRVRELGCRNTVFKNPNGLPAPGQVTTARDMMIIFQHVLAVDELRRICSIPNFTLTTQIGSQRVKNHNKLLGTYPGMGPAKTGWTVASRHTYAASATRNGRELLLVLLKSPNKWVDARALFDYGFSTGRDPADAGPAPGPVLARQDAPQVPASPKASAYTVRSGDTLSSIARRHGVSVATLVEKNRLNDPDQLQPGMQLRIP
jgi:D-alanyl-D-alanine carboxypeptidase